LFKIIAAELRTNPELDETDDFIFIK